jgi:hypothetical protein
VTPVKYEPGLYIPEDGILHSHLRGNLKLYNVSLCCIYYGDYPYVTVSHLKQAHICCDYVSDLEGSLL